MVVVALEYSGRTDAGDDQARGLEVDADFPACPRPRDLPFGSTASHGATLSATPPGGDLSLAVAAGSGVRSMQESAGQICCAGCVNSCLAPLGETVSRSFLLGQRLRRGDCLALSGDVASPSKIADHAPNVALKEKRARPHRLHCRRCPGFGIGICTGFMPWLPGRILTTDSHCRSDGKGSVNRQEALQTNVAARVERKVLPNGNLVVRGQAGKSASTSKSRADRRRLVRPEDIQSDNTIDSAKNRAGPHRLWRPRPDHRRAATPLWPAGDGRAAAVSEFFIRAPTSRREPRRGGDVLTRPPSAPLTEAVVVYRAAPTISVRAMTHPPPVDQLGLELRK